MEPAADRMFLLGSFDPTRSPGIWTYDLNSNAWAEIATSSYVPDWRARMVYASESDRFIVFPYASDRYVVVHDLNTGGEERRALLSGADLPEPRENGSMIYVEDLDRVLLFSGYPLSGTDFPTDVWLYDLDGNTWKEAEP